MKTTYDRETQQLRLSFDSPGERASFIESARQESGFLVTLPLSLRLHQVVPVELGSPADTSAVEARVAQVFEKGFGRFGTAFLVDDWTTAIGPATPENPPRLKQANETEPPGADAAEQANDGGADGPSPDHRPPDAASKSTTSEDPGPELDPNEGELRGVSPIHVIKQMNPRQRSMLALKATRTQRRILLRDNSPQVLQNLLANPHIDSEEILQISRSSHVVAPILQRIASDSRWSSNQEILGVIARHPKTPSIFAARLLPNLRTSDLRMMAKMSSGLREMTRKAALREYMRRTGQRI